jgi:hypothetical protein
VIDGALTRLLGRDGQQSPEKAAAAVQAMTKGGKSTGDLKTLAQIRAATIKSGAWNEIASTLIRMGGQPANSPGRDFNPQTFVHWYADMSEPARAMLFGNSELRKSLDGFVAVNQRLQKVNALRNTSQHGGEPHRCRNCRNNGRVTGGPVAWPENGRYHGRQLRDGESVDQSRVRSPDYRIFEGGRIGKPERRSLADRPHREAGGDQS